MIADLMDCKKNAIENSTRTGSADGNFNAKSWATLTSAQDFRIIYQSGQRFFTKNLGLFALRHSAGNTYPYPKIGYVASKAKAGNAPQRNRAKRRLRDLARKHLFPCAAKDCNYILVATNSTGICKFAVLEKDLQAAIRHLKLAV